MVDSPDVGLKRSGVTAKSRRSGSGSRSSGRGSWPAAAILPTAGRRSNSVGVGTGVGRRQSRTGTSADPLLEGFLLAPASGHVPTRGFPGDRSLSWSARAMFPTIRECHARSVLPGAVARLGLR